MVMLALGLGVLALLFWAAHLFSRASVAGVKAFVTWVLALAGLCLAALLFISGRGGLAISAGIMFGPLLFRWIKQRAAPGLADAPPPSPRAGPMTREEALEILGLADPVSEAEIRTAWVRLMRVAHPDGGGSDWLASRVNQAKDVLLKRR